MTIGVDVGGIQAGGLMPPLPDQSPTSVFNQASGQLDKVTAQMTGLFGANPAPALLQAYNDIQQAYSGRLNDPVTALSDLYMEYLGRSPDPQGLAYYQTQLARGTSLDQIASQIRSSPEARRHGYVDRSWDPTGIVGIGPTQFNHIDLQAWQQTVSAAETWASNVGWKYFPSLVTLYNAMQAGVYTDPQTAANFFSKTAVSPDTLAKTPWAASGDTQQQWRDRQNSFLDAIQVYTGGRDPFNQNLFNQAMTEKWSTQRLTNTLLNDPAFQNKYGWTKYGMTYQSFQQYKIQNRPAVAQRYGVQAAQSDTAYLSDLGNPLQAVHASAGPISVSQAVQQHNIGLSQVR